MTITLDLPEELEQELSAEAKELGLSLSEYALRVLSTGLIVGDRPRTGAEFNLAELVSRMPLDYQVSEEGFGAPVGKEEW